MYEMIHVRGYNFAKLIIQRQASLLTTLIPLLTMLLLASPAMLTAPALIAEKGLAIAMVYTVFAISLTWLPFAVFRLRVALVVMSPFLLLLPAEILHIIEYEGYSTISAFASIVETNPKEALEFLHAYRLYLYTLLPLTILLLLAAMLSTDRNARLQPPIRAAIALSFVATLILFYGKLAVENFQRQNPVMASAGELSQRLVRSSYPPYLIYKIVVYVDNRMELEALSAVREGFSFEIERALNPPEVVVLVIGETSRAANWSLLGYERETNPRLSQRENLLFFTRALTAATHTRESIQLALTRANPRDLQPVMVEKSLISLFSEAGYHTVWLSNQDSVSAVDTPVTVLAREADITRFLGGTYQIDAKYDEELIPLLAETLESTPDQPLLIVIHTIGSHEVYRLRYPERFAKFTPVSTGDDYNFASDGIRERLLNSYDNSIVYTDYVIDQFVQTIVDSGREAAMVYFSDHGENILDDGNERFGHGGVIPTHYVTEIPLFMWFSESFVERRTRLVEGLAAKRSEPVTTLDLFETIAALGNIKGIKKDGGINLVDQTPSDREIFILNTKKEPLPLSAIDKSW